MARDFPIRQDLERLGVPSRTIFVLEKAALIVDAIERITGTETSLETVSGQIDTINESIEDAELSLTSLDTRLDTLETDAPYVSQDVGAEWTAATVTEARTALADYTAPTISNPPTQAEVQAIADALQAVVRAAGTAINDLKDNGALT